MAFKEPFQDPNGVLSNLSAYIQDCYGKWAKDKGTKDWKSPYLSICQSSGWGKSRAIKELTKDFPYLIYVSTATGTGFPIKNPLGLSLQQHLEKAKTVIITTRSWAKQLSFHDICIKIFMCFLYVCLGHVANKKNVETFQNVDSNEANDADATTMANTFEACFIVDHDTVPPDEVALQNNESSIKEMMKDNTKPVLFAFDEARELLLTKSQGNQHDHHHDGSPIFRAWRTALAQVGKHCKIFALVMDTTYRISNFTPTAERDPSARPDNNTGVKLFAPFIHFRNMDIFQQSTTNNNNNNNKVWTLGRPLWGAFEKHLPFDDLLQFACHKLLGGAQAKRLREIFIDEYRSLAALAILCCQHSISIHPYTRTPSELVASYMATCLYISPTRDMMLVDYPSEPILSMAAEQLLASDEDYDIALDCLISHLSTGVISKGNMGELVARMIVLRCMSKCRQEQQQQQQQQQHFNATATATTTTATAAVAVTSVVQQQVPLRNFIRMLCPSVSVDTLKQTIPQSLNRTRNSSKTLVDHRLILDGTVNFSHFIAVYNNPSPKDIGEFYRRQAAIIVQSNTIGIDLLIPVALPNEKSEAFGVMVFQIKNHGDETSSSDVKHHIHRFLDSFSSQLVSFACIMIFGGKKAPSSKPIADSNRLFLELIRYEQKEPLFTGTQWDKLFRLLNLSDDPVELLDIKDEEKSNIRMMYALKYPRAQKMAKTS